MSVIIYDNGEGGVGVVWPVASCGLTIEAIARKDVPSGAPYRIVPDDFFGDTPQEEWTADFSSSDVQGSSEYGNGSGFDVVGYFTENELLFVQRRCIETGEVSDVQA